MVRCGKVRTEKAFKVRLFSIGIKMDRGFHETDIEKLFREELERRGLRRGIDFTPQYPIRYSFILDFAFPQEKLAIEVDGEKWHDTPNGRQKDWFKDSILTKLGWEVMRFKGQEVLTGVAGCVDKVLNSARLASR